MKIIFILLKSFVSILGLITMFFASIFYLGSKEQFDTELADNFFGFFFSRFLFTFCAGLIFFILSIILNQLFHKKLGISKKVIAKMALFEILLILIFTTFFTLFAINYHF